MINIINHIKSYFSILLANDCVILTGSPKTGSYVKMTKQLELGGFKI